MPRLPRPGQDDGTWGDVLNDFLAVSHMDDGTVRVDALPEPQVSDGSITPQKLSTSYVPTSQKGSLNGVATLDNTGRIPAGQMPSGSMASDASTSTKGVVQLAGDLSGTASLPTVPALAVKYEKPASGIPEADLSSDVVTKLNTGGAIGDSSSSTKGLIKLAGDLSGTADLPTVPGLDLKVDLTEKGAIDGVAELDGTGRVPVAQLPAGYESDATTTSKGIIKLAGDLAGTADAPTVPGKANDSEVVHKTGNETITGLKVFTSLIEIPGPPVKTTDATNKAYVDSLVPVGGVSDATTLSKGVVQLSGDLGGTAATPVIATGAVTSAKIADGTIVDGDISSSAAITQSKISGLTGALAAKEPTLTAGSTSQYYRGDKSWQTLDKGAVGLANVDNTSDANKPVSGAAQTALNLKAPLASPTFTGTVTVPTPTNPTDATTKTYVDTTITGAATPDATAAVKGKIQLAGDIAGTAAAPTVPGLANKVNSSLLGANNGVATLDNSGKLSASQLPRIDRLPAFSATGSLMTDIGTHRLYNDSGATWTIASVRSSVGTAPAGSSVITDINVDGTSIFTTQANRPTIAAAGNTSGKVTNMNITSVSDGSYLTVDVDQIGSSTPGSNLTVQIEVY